MSKIKQKSTIKDMILATIEKHIDAQNAKGLKKYGQTLEDCAANDYDWQKMALEEAIDLMQYQWKEIDRLTRRETSKLDDSSDSNTEQEQSPSEALESAVGENKAISKRDEIIEDLVDEINGLKDEIVELEGNRDEWCQVSRNAMDEIVDLRRLLVRAWEG